MGKLINKGNSSFKVIALYQNIAQYKEISCSEILVICPQWGCGGPQVQTFIYIKLFFSNRKLEFLCSLFILYQKMYFILFFF